MTSALLGSRAVRERAAALGVHPRRRWGQNFVVDPNTIERLVRLAQVQPGEVVCEVGPGLGSLTGALLAAGARVCAVEIDPVLADALPGFLSVAAESPAGGPPGGVVAVVHADAATIGGSLICVAGAPATRLVANLPYNAATPIVLNLLAQCPDLADGVVMVQAEMAARWAAAPGAAAYGSPTVKLAWDVLVRRLGPVPRTAFWPIPDVDSTLVGFTRTPPPGPADLRGPTFAIVDAAFAQRRKTLRQALAGLAGGAQLAAEWLTAADIDPARRGESLAVGDFMRLAASRPGLVSRG